MRKLAILLVAIMLMSMVVTGCTQATSGQSGESGTETGGKDKLKVTFIVNANLGDKSFNDSAHAGLKRAEKDFGIELKTIELGGDTTKQEPTLLEEVETDTDIIIFPSGGLEEIAFRIAADYKDKKFIPFDMPPNAEVKDPNIYCLSFKPNESSFLAGAVGAKVSKTGVIGFIAGQEMQLLNDFLVGYIAGAKLANPDIKVAVSYIGSWTDSAKGKELALVQKGQGADVIHAVASAAGLGVIDAAKENKFWALGVDSDQAALFMETDPGKANAILTSALKNVGDALYGVIEKELKNQVKWGTLERVGLDEGISGIAKNDIYNKNVSPEVRAWVDELEQKVKSGEIVVPSAFSMTEQEVIDLRNSVKP